MIENIKAGDKVSITKSFSEDDVMQFAKLSSDDNPIHVDAEYAKSSVFRQRIVHGMLVASLFSAILGTKLPGIGAVYLGQSLSFKKPIVLDEEVTAVVEVMHIREDKPIITLKTECFNSNGEIAIEGEAIVKV